MISFNFVSYQFSFFQPSGISIFCLPKSHDNCIINLQDLCISFKMSKQSCGVIGNVLLRKQNVKAVLLYPNRKIERSSEDHGIIKFTFNIDDTDLFTKVSVCRAVFFHQQKRVGLNFSSFLIFLSCLTILSIGR